MNTPDTKFYLFEVRDSDDNNCSVFDVIVEAKDRDTASETLWAHLAKCYPDDESDGSFGTFHACDCRCDHGIPVTDCDACIDGWECDHGGLLTNEDVPGTFGPQEYVTLRDARDHRAAYHSHIELLCEDS